jgi:hypothetical protein
MWGEGHTSRHFVRFLMAGGRAVLASDSIFAVTRKCNAEAKLSADGLMRTRSATVAWDLQHFGFDW